jgi:hypothetical protein
MKDKTEEFETNNKIKKKDGINFVSVYFKIRTSDQYDVNYI